MVLGLDLFQHMVECISEDTQLIISLLFGPNGIIPVLGNGGGSIRQNCNGALNIF